MVFQDGSAVFSKSFIYNQHSINDVILIPLELIRRNRDAVRRAREAHLIHKGNTLSLGINSRTEARVTRVLTPCNKP